ncbi:MAG: DUF3857 and transglutaminase domain-containing protein [Candidatus Zixiibacteriota bacterium]|nr:MAG: DUF3857 and transglutaminase domain-containing protein [candidate division Zixibacteria bacterium]
MIHRSAEVKISRDGDSKTHWRRALKILRPSAVERGFLEVPVRDTRKVKNLKGWLIRPGEETRLLDKNLIVEISGEMAAGYYSDDRKLGAGFLDIRAGDIVAYEFDIENKDEFGAGHHGFVFQDKDPVVTTSYKVEIPAKHKLHISGQNLGPVTFQQEKRRYRWTSGYLPYREDEPFMPPGPTLYREVVVASYDPDDSEERLYKTWEEASRWMYSICDPPATPGDSIRKTVGDLISGIDEPLEQLRTIAEFVRDKVRYVGIWIGPGRILPRPAEKTFHNKYGDCKDKVALTRAMLAAAGIPTAPALALVGGVVDSTFPSPFQFNHVILAIPQSAVPSLDRSLRAVGEEWFFFDPTDERTPFGSLDLRAYNTFVLVGSEEGEALCRLPSIKPEQRLRRNTAVATLNPNGSIEANVRITDYGAYADETQAYLNDIGEKKQTEYAEYLVSDCLRNPVVSELQIVPGNDSLSISFRVTADNYFAQVGELYLLKADFIHSDGSHFFGDCDRTYPIWLGRPRNIELDITWKLPTGWQIDDSPNDIQSSCAAADITGSLTIENASLRHRWRLHYNGDMLPLDSCGSARTFVDNTRAVVEKRIMLISNGSTSND